MGFMKHIQNYLLLDYSRRILMIKYHMVHDQPLELPEAMLISLGEDMKEDTECTRCFGLGHKLWI